MKNSNEKDVVEYLKTLSPSGIEIEFISLSSFEIEAVKKEGENLVSPNKMISKMLSVFLKLVQGNSDVDFVQALLNNFLKLHNDIIIDDLELTE